MTTNYKINNVDIDEIYETFETSVAEQYGVTDSKFTDSIGKFKKNGQPLKTAIGKTLPTSAGTYLNGLNTCTKYKVNGQPIDVALKGCRPIGIPLRDVGAGSYVIYRSGNKTYFASGTQPTGGEELPYNPQYVFFELQGPGGGGGGTQNLYSGSGPNSERRAATIQPDR